MFPDLKTLYHRAAEHRALDLLHDSSHYPGLKELDPWDLKLQLYVVPSFHPYMSWSLFTEDDGSYTVRRVRWDQIADHRPGLELGEPTIYGSDTLHPAEDLDPWLNQLKGIAFPPFLLKSSLGIDGTTFGLRAASSSAQSADVSWWSRPPAGWESLAEWYHAFVAHLEAHATPHTNRLRTGVEA